MDNTLIRRITVIEQSGENPQAVTVYRQPRKRRRVSVVLRPFHQAARHLVRSQVVFGNEILRRDTKANRRRRDGGLLEAPAIVLESGRKAYNEVRKAAPFRILPKA
jgi:Family of unknown function (DUF6312)